MAKENHWAAVLPLQLRIIAISAKTIDTLRFHVKIKNNGKDSATLLGFKNYWKTIDLPKISIELTTAMNWIKY